jgi:hypothetical protein
MYWELAKIDRTNWSNLTEHVSLRRALIKKAFLVQASGLIFSFKNTRLAFLQYCFLLDYTTSEKGHVGFFLILNHLNIVKTVSK